MDRFAWAGLILLVLMIGIADGNKNRFRSPGIVAPAEPVQSSAEHRKPWKKNDYLIRPLAKFSIKGLALLVDHYRWDREAQLSPVDITFGWGPMSDSSVLSKLSLRHGIRHYSWHSRSLPMDSAQINRHAANMHMIPADNYAEITLNKVGQGDIVTIDGYLVEVAHPDGYQWRSSLTREDSGQGACEVVWVDRIRIE